MVLKESAETPTELHTEQLEHQRGEGALCSAGGEGGRTGEGTVKVFHRLQSGEPGPEA